MDVQKSVKLIPSEITHWFNAIRNLPDNERTRALDAFWDGQIDSKIWLVDELNKIHNEPSDIYIFGGWIGVLASVMLQSSTFTINKIRSIDLDPWCEDIADTVCKPHESDAWKFKAVTADMRTYQYESSPTVVINTSTEHVTKEVYDQWYSSIPMGTLVVAQGNNFFDCSEHVRCSTNLDEFMQDNNVKYPIYSGVLKTSMYDRYMSIWNKL